MATKSRIGVRAFTALILLCRFYMQLNSVNITATASTEHVQLWDSAYEPEHLLVKFRQEGSLPWTIPNAIPQTSSHQFMQELIELKRRRNIPIPWMNTTDVKLPTPIFVLNLPKSGTTAVHQYFTCAKISSSHTYTKVNTGGKQRIATCLHQNHLKDQEGNSTLPLQGCDGYAALTDIGNPGQDSGQCYYSSLHEDGLEYISKYYPNATILLITREAKSWYQSVSNWHSGIMFRRWKRLCGFPGYLIDGDEEEQWVYFYKAHTQKIR